MQKISVSLFRQTDVFTVWNSWVTRHLFLHLLTSRPFHCMFIISTITALLMNSLGLICCTHKNIHRKNIEQLVLYQLWIPALILLKNGNVLPESMQSKIVHRKRFIRWLRKITRFTIIKPLIHPFFSVLLLGINLESVQTTLAFTWLHNNDFDNKMLKRSILQNSPFYM